jgi:hypothetical protein
MLQSAKITSPVGPVIQKYTEFANLALVYFFRISQHFIHNILKFTIFNSQLYTPQQSTKNVLPRAPSRQIESVLSFVKFFYTPCSIGARKSVILVNSDVL